MKRPRIWWLFPDYYRALPPEIVDRILHKARAAGISEPGEALFQHIRYADEMLTNDRLNKRLESFQNKYGFSRNLSFTCFVLATGFFVKNHLTPNPELVRYGIAATAGGVLLFYRYLKFFRQYSDELFNTFAGRK